MKLGHGLHLAYCTNIHRGESWVETFYSLKNKTLRVRERISPKQPYGIGLRLSHRAAFELSERPVLTEFQRWLAQNQCYVFTINGFPFGQFHGTRVKEQVYLPNWTSLERLDYTNLLFELLAQLLPEGVEGTVSTLPGGFKDHVTSADELKLIRDNLWRCVEHIARLSAQTGRKLSLGLEPEPCCLLETTSEVVPFFDRLRAEHPNDPRLAEHLGITYDTCHLAVEFEEPQQAVAALQQHGIRIIKFHLSSALKANPTAKARQALAAFADEVYLHQVVIRRPDGDYLRYRDLADALATESALGEPAPTSATLHSALCTLHSLEWRVHFHVPLHASPIAPLENTADHLLGVLDLLAANPALCSHLEMETYTWEVLPGELKGRDVVEQLVAEYDWTLARLAERGLRD